MRRRRRDQWDANLAWYFESAAGELGLRAAPLERGTSSDAAAREVDEGALAAASRWRRVHGALARLTDEQRRVLWLAHADVPRVLRPCLGRLGDLLLVVLYVDAGLYDAPSHGGSSMRVLRARAEAERRVVDAVAAYQVAVARREDAALGEAPARGPAAVRLRRFFDALSGARDGSLGIRRPLPIAVAAE